MAMKSRTLMRTPLHLAGRTALVGLIFGATVVAGVALAATGDGGEAGPPTSPDGASTPTWVEGDAKGERAAEGPKEGAPDDAVDPATMPRELEGTTSGGTISRAELPDGSVCVVVERAGGGFLSCSTAEEYRHGRLVVTFQADEASPVEAFGLLPEGASSAEVAGRPAEVSGSAWYAELPRGTTSITVVDDSGESTQVAIPGT
jgi:hypothetical protein